MLSKHGLGHFSREKNSAKIDSHESNWINVLSVYNITYKAFIDL